MIQDVEGGRGKGERERDTSHQIPSGLRWLDLTWFEDLCANNYFTLDPLPRHPQYCEGVGINQLPTTGLRLLHLMLLRLEALAIPLLYNWGLNVETVDLGGFKGLERWNITQVTLERMKVLPIYLYRSVWDFTFAYVWLLLTSTHIPVCSLKLI